MEEVSPVLSKNRDLAGQLSAVQGKGKPSISNLVVRTQEY